MLSSTLPHVDNRPIGQHPLVKSLMSGRYNIQVRVHLGPGPGCSLRVRARRKVSVVFFLKICPLKTVTLIALASLLFVSEMAIISPDSLVFFLQVVYCLRFVIVCQVSTKAILNNYQSLPITAVLKRNDTQFIKSK